MAIKTASQTKCIKCEKELQMPKYYMPRISEEKQALPPHEQHNMPLCRVCYEREVVAQGGKLEYYD
jgi:hypothetical protein